jgi:hypothetical protein
MTVSISFPAELEGMLRERAAAAGQDVAAFVQQAVSERLAAEVGPPPTEAASHEEFVKRLLEIIDLHPVSTWPVDDSRESIYAGRGE